MLQTIRLVLVMLDSHTAGCLAGPDRQFAWHGSFDKQIRPEMAFPWLQ